MLLQGFVKRLAEIKGVLAMLQANVQRIELDLRWDTKEFTAALEDSKENLRPLPPTVEVSCLIKFPCAGDAHHTNMYWERWGIDFVSAYNCAETYTCTYLNAQPSYKGTMTL